ncbi:HNH endonuclease signature motif containing protein [Henriciella sp.]|uniref:HNH endonuclease n=1 Tax=Henriciella sp. TaxID=1968823 RepID=UPI0026042BC1|nr:HNH endonuclease signature motif containing protein [Henriciella sp.]
MTPFSSLPEAEQKRPAVKRKPLTRQQFGALLVKQDCRCAKCGGKLDFSKPRQVIDEHLQPLADGGNNDLDNRALYCAECAKGKTVKEATPRARSKRYAEGRTQADKRAARGGSTIQGRKNPWPPKGSRKIQTRK